MYGNMNMEQHEIFSRVSHGTDAGLTYLDISVDFVLLDFMASISSCMLSNILHLWRSKLRASFTTTVQSHSPEAVFNTQG